MCEHLRMDPKDDPEARIRELERPLADTARISELGTGNSASGPGTQPWTHGASFPPPPPGPPAPWPGYEQFPAPPQPRRRTNAAPLLFVFGAALMLLVAGGVTAALRFTDTGSEDSGSHSDSRSTTIRQTTISGVQLPGPVVPTQIPAGQTVIVSGIGENRALECQDNTVTVSGMQNKLEITGHCDAVIVSGIENIIVVDSAATIGVSGFDNRVTFHTGQPEVSNSGQSNVVEQG